MPQIFQTIQLFIKKGRGCLRKLKTENPTSYHTEYKKLSGFAS